MIDFHLEENSNVCKVLGGHVDFKGSCIEQKKSSPGINPGKKTSFYRNVHDQLKC